MPRLSQCQRVKQCLGCLGARELRCEAQQVLQTSEEPNTVLEVFPKLYFSTTQIPRCMITIELNSLLCLSKVQYCLKDTIVLSIWFKGPNSPVNKVLQLLVVTSFLDPQQYVLSTQMCQTLLRYTVRHQLLYSDGT